ncbi:MAG: cytidine deaminase [Kiritimatiellia bacterium]|jgi:cytidine deaminase|nr:cytidine deaminase [Kiritimatiellia bacterium]
MNRPEDIDLLEKAAAATTNAHAPYSGFQVGAAVETDDGTVFVGCNVENASYGLTMCAERTAIFSAVAEGHRSFARIAVVASGDTLPYPCGACRQVLSEFCDDDMKVLVAAADNLEDYKTVTLGDLLPHAFRLEKP